MSKRFVRLDSSLVGTYILWFGIFDPIATTALLFEIFSGQERMPYGHLWFSTTVDLLHFTDATLRSVRRILWDYYGNT